jgi:GR25 family glycosyltransferase involved in LPS biosynthesis
MYGSRRGVIACTLSHWALANALLQDDAYEAYIVLEDDVELHPLWHESIDQVYHESRHFDVCFLGYHIQRHLKSSLSSFMLNVNDVPRVNRLDTSLFMGGSFAYILGKKGARQIVNNLNHYGMQKPIDVLNPYFLHCSLGQCIPFAASSEWSFDRGAKRP